MRNEEIWVVDDDNDDHEILTLIGQELGVSERLRFFNDAQEVLSALKGSDLGGPFIILCDVNLPGSDGFRLRREMLKQPNKKFHSVPFIFWTTNASDTQVDRAFREYAHGFFIKEESYKEWRNTLKTIIEYWLKSRMPSKQDAYEAPL